MIASLHKPEKNPGQTMDPGSKGHREEKVPIRTGK